MNVKNTIKCKEANDCLSCSKKIISWSIAGSLFLAILKFASGALSRSAGLTADGIQSLACVIGSLMIMYSLMISKKKPDKLFPYGYGKIEFIVSLVVFSLLIGLGFFISLSSLLLILKRNLEAPDIRGLPVAAISVFLNYLIYSYSYCAGTKLDSSGIIANAHQSKADMFSSVAVGAGIIIAQFSPSLAIFDPIAAFIVGILIIKDSFVHWFVNLKVILDRIPDPKYREIIIGIISESLPDAKQGFIKFKSTGKKFWVGIGLGFPDTYKAGKIEEKTNIVKNKMLKEAYWAGEIDFFVEPDE